MHCMNRNRGRIRYERDEQDERDIGPFRGFFDRCRNEWLQSREAQRFIRDFSKDKYGELQLFPNSPEAKKL
jgi:hypothetical protein